MYIALCIVVFLLTYLLNAVTITIGYHRGLAHESVVLHPRLRRAVILLGNWITGLDPKAWSVMHRMHHAYSDTPEDPHSPVNVGLVGILMEQLRSYENVIRGLAKGDEKYTRHAHGLDFELSWLNRNRVWWLPYVLHFVVFLAIALTFNAWWLGYAWFAGMMSHPFQGGMVNSLGHAIGHRNFETPDQSRNNMTAAMLILGEGYQNNHHRYPASAKFSYRWFEVDLGYGFCQVFDRMGVLSIKRDLLIPDAPSYASLTSALETLADSLPDALAEPSSISPATQG